MLFTMYPTLVNTVVTHLRASTQLIYDYCGLYSTVNVKKVVSLRILRTLLRVYMCVCAP
jgi:hypothetical protein